MCLKIMHSRHGLQLMSMNALYIVPIQSTTILKRPQVGLASSLFILINSRILGFHAKILNLKTV